MQCFSLHVHTFHEAPFKCLAVSSPKLEYAWTTGHLSAWPLYVRTSTVRPPHTAHCLAAAESFNVYCCLVVSVPLESTKSPAMNLFEIVTASFTHLLGVRNGECAQCRHCKQITNTFREHVFQLRPLELVCFGRRLDALPCCCFCKIVRIINRRSEIIGRQLWRRSAQDRMLVFIFELSLHTNTDGMSTARIDVDQWPSPEIGMSCSHT